MATWKQKAEAEMEKQRLIDEIHQKPEVRKTFIVCEVFLTLDWFANMIFFGLLAIGLYYNSLDSVVDISTIIYILLDSIGGYGVATIFIVVKILLDRLKKSQRAKLEVLEQAGLEEAKIAKEAGTYQPGKGPSLLYRIFYGFRAILGIVVYFGFMIYLLTLVY